MRLCHKKYLQVIKMKVILEKTGTLRADLKSERAGKGREEERQKGIDWKKKRIVESLKLLKASNPDRFCEHPKWMTIKTVVGIATGSAKVRQEIVIAEQKRDAQLHLFMNGLVNNPHGCGL
jgi:hypothetical protein